jgi:hypothetical protein
MIWRRNGGVAAKRRAKVVIGVKSNEGNGNAAKSLAAKMASVASANGVVA